MARKAYTVIFALGFLLCFVGHATSIAQACSPACDMSCDEQSRGWNELREPHNCCDGFNESSCGLCPTCCLEFPAFAVSIVPKAENRQYADSTVDAIHVIPVIDFLMRNNNVAEPLVIGPPVSLFLKNLSLLC